MKSHQAFRSNRALMLAYWNNRCWRQYLSGPVHEIKGHGQTLVPSSAHGIAWATPPVDFPPFRPPNDRLLMIGCFGRANHPNDGAGIGGPAREVKDDGMGLKPQGDRHALTGGGTD